MFLLGVGAWCFFALHLAPEPLKVDQLNIVSILDYISRAQYLDFDPIYKLPDLYLQVNLGVLLFEPLKQLFGSYELGVSVFLFLFYPVYLWSAYLVFKRLSLYPIEAMIFAIVSTSFIETAGATFWGISFPDRFGARVLMLPFIPVFFFFLIEKQKFFSAKSAFLFGLALGLLAWIHPISTGYLALGSFLYLCIENKQRYNIGFSFLGGYGVGASTFLIPFFLDQPSSQSQVLPDNYQELISTIYPWAFNFPRIFEEVKGTLQAPLVIALLVGIFLLPRSRKPFPVLVASFLLASTLPYLFQVIMYSVFGKPFFFVELWRGFRYIPYILILWGISAYSQLARECSFRKMSSRVMYCFPIVLLALSLFQSYTPTKFLSKSEYTCSDTIYSSIRKIPFNSVVVIHDAYETRMCGQRAVYVSPLDLAMAYYHSPRAVKQFIERLREVGQFYKSPSEKGIQGLRKKGATHILSGEELSFSLLDQLACSHKNCLYRIKAVEESEGGA